MGSLVCRVELHKKNGIIITVENSDAKILQTLVMDGNTITTTCKGDEKSVITQTPDGITIKCKDFLLDAETIKCKSGSNTEHKSDGKFKITSADAMKLSSGAALKASAESGMKLSASSIKAKASSGDVKISGVNVAIKADVKAAVKANMLELKGAGMAKLEGGLVDVKGNIANVKGDAIATLGGGIVNVG